jgi:hypothetical protein
MKISNKMKIITEPLSQEDVKKLKQETIKSYILTSVFTIVFFAAFYYAYEELFIQNKGFSIDAIFTISVSLIMGGVVMYLLYLNTQIQKDIKSGQKEVLMGILTDKRERYNKRSNSVGDKTKYYFYLDEEKIQLDTAIADLIYYKAQIGQKIIIQRTIKSQTILKMEVLNEIENKTE